MNKINETEAIEEIITECISECNNLLFQVFNAKALTYVFSITLAKLKKRKKIHSFSVFALDKKTISFAFSIKIKKYEFIAKFDDFNGTICIKSKNSGNIIIHPEVVKEPVRDKELDDKLLELI